MSQKGRLRRLERGVEWLETEGRFRRIENMIKLLEMKQEIADRIAADPAARVRWNEHLAWFPLPKPRVAVREEVAPRVKPILRDAAVPAAPQDEDSPEPAPPHPEERRIAARLEGLEAALPPAPTPAPRPVMPGQPVTPPQPDMEIRPTRWRPRGEQDYDEEERPGTNGRCITEYDPLRDEDDDDDDDDG